MKQCLSNFDSTPLTCEPPAPALFPGKNIPNIAKSDGTKNTGKVVPKRPGMVGMVPRKPAKFENPG